MRPVLVLIHRYIGLVTAAFLLVAGITGSLLAFNDELSGMVSPGLHDIRPPAPDTPLLDPLDLRDRALALGPGVQADYVYLGPKPGVAAVYLVPGAAKPRVALDPYTGNVVRRSDGPAFSETIMPFAYSLHYSLALGDWGIWIMGLVALAWTLDCFVGAYLTFPVAASRQAELGAGASAGSWMRRWWTAWRIRRSTNAYKFNFDLHRAGGLWLWAILFIFAWSSVGFNLGSVYNPVMRSMFEFQTYREIAPLSKPQTTPGMTWRAARDTARRLMRDELAKRNLRPGREFMLGYDPATATFSYSVWSSADRADRRNPSTSLTFDANTGKTRAFSSTLDEKLGDTITRWLFDLHMGKIWGRPYEILLSVIGVGVAMLSVTGLVIWWKKRAARVLRRRKMHAGSSAISIDFSPTRETAAAE